MAISNEAIFISNKTLCRPGGGTPNKYKELERFIIETVRRYWESGTPISPEQLHHKVLKHIDSDSKENPYEDFVHSKRSTLNCYVQRVLKRNRFSIRKIPISQRVPADWRSKAEENTARIRATFLKEDVDVVINADETFLLFHPFGQRLIAPTGVKQVGSVVQVDAGVKKRYHQYRSTMPVTIGKKITVSREQRVDFVLDTIDEINQDNNDYPYITNAFKRCRLNPWSKNSSLEAFQQHLMQPMINNQKAVPLID
jgi:hypothetical protein